MEIKARGINWIGKKEKEEVDNSQAIMGMLKVMADDVKHIRSRQENQISEQTKMAIRLALVEEMTKVLVENKLNEEELKKKIADWASYSELIN
ncbi:hypothetical protein [Tissierella sp.]|uniref:hypothetical protein n=1 Tax=Tissierella sp. TaxID=41274 RepID=UPI003028EF60